MKKICFSVLFIFLLSFSALAQCCHCYQNKVNSRAHLASFFVKYDLYEGWGVGYMGHFRKYGYARFANPYIGVELNQFSVGAQAGTRWSLYMGECFKVHFMTGVAWLYRVNLGFEHDHLISETVREQKKMVGMFRLGPTMEYKRFGFYTSFNPGLSWNNQEPLFWKSNLYYYWGGEAGFYVLF